MEWALAVVALALIAFGVVSRRVDGTPVTPAIIFVGVGLLVGAHGLDLVDPSPSGESVKLLAEATLTVVLFADASRIDLRTLRREYVVPARLLGIGLPLTIALGALLAAALFGALSVPEAVVLAVLLAPTDAALGQAVVTEPRLPSRIRQGLNVESGLNDGICVPLLFIVLAVAEADADEVSAAHAVRIVVEEIGYGIVGGVLAGAVAAAAITFASKRGLIERSWLQILPVAGAALAYGIAAPLGGSGFIAAFVAGMTFGVLRRPSEGGEVTFLTDELGELLNGVTLLVFGAVLLWPALDGLTWRIALYAVASLTIVRMAPVAIAMLGTGARRPTLAFLGWFGPRGLASIVFAVIVVQEADLPHTSTILLTTYATVGLSVLLHGLTAAPLAARYASWFASHPRDALPAMESIPAGAHRWRRPSALDDHTLISAGEDSSVTAR
jgi:NhaP-type Na+/H+ or K+/H+ antiporter